jgi:hypothetical protein
MTYIPRYTRMTYKGIKSLAWFKALRGSKPCVVQNLAWFKALRGSEFTNRKRAMIHDTVENQKPLICITTQTPVSDSVGGLPIIHRLRYFRFGPYCLLRMRVLPSQKGKATSQCWESTSTPLLLYGSCNQ